jgi:ABC-type multidrug transport system fused ATPase/permease subunit
MASIWVNLRLEPLSSLLTLTLCVLGVASEGSASLIGLAITYALGFTMQLNFLLFSSAQFENEFNSVERLMVYCNDIPEEPELVNTNDPSAEKWPLHGAIEFNDICLAYPSRPDVQILKNLSFKVQAGENIGVIGRTGSGKSTLMTALFRLVELEQGSIVIDDIDISHVGLHTLRKSIQIIPQEPVLFSGTIRENLDVESKYSDVDVWDILQRIGLKEYVSGLTDKLSSPVLENGEKLSVGQRQLICLGRAILTKPRILIMDEATASVDSEADKLIQESIKTLFKNTTVLSITHRLNTIADFDKVLVLQDVRKIEFSPPHTLLSDSGSLFYQLAEATGVSNLGVLKSVAKAKFDEQ